MKSIKRMKKFFGIITAIVLTIGILPAMPVAASGNVTVAVSSSSLNIGDTVTITATAQGPNGEQTQAALGFNYDSTKLSFVSCGDSNYSGGEGGQVNVTASKASITLKAVAAGSAAISVSGSNGVVSSDGTSLGELSAGGTTITVNNASGGAAAGSNGQDNAVKSGDNSLSSLSISPGTLSPAFKYSTTSYTAAVNEDVTEVTVDAKPSNSKAVIESISGSQDLKAGANTITVVVKAENGITAVYKIVVTKGGTAGEEPKEEEGNQQEGASENPEAINVNGHDYNLAPTIPQDRIPADFKKTTVTCRGKEAEALQFEKGDLVLVYLTTPDTEVKNTLAVYDQAADNIYPFRNVSLGENYVIILDPPAETGLSSAYTAATVEIGEFGPVSAFGMGSVEEGENSGAEQKDFYLVYAVSSTGNKGWYQYDSVEKTFQRYVAGPAEEAADTPKTEDTGMKALQKAYNKLDEQYKSEKSAARRNMAVLIFLIAVAVIVIVNLLLRGRKNDEDDWEDDFEEVPRRFARKEKEKENGNEREKERETLKEKKKAKEEKTTEPEERPDRQKKDRRKNGRLTEEEPLDHGISGRKEESEKQSVPRKTEEAEAEQQDTSVLKKPLEEAPQEDDFEVIDLDDL